MNDDREKAERFFEEVHAELMRAASDQLQREGPGHTLETAALVHEAWIRFQPSIEQGRMKDMTRSDFYRLCVHIMRHHLVDEARRRARQKHGGGWQKMPLDVAEPASEDRSGDLVLRADVIALHESLEALAAVDPRKAEVVSLRFFGGLAEPVIADVLDVARSTVARDWRWARAWLGNWLHSRDGADAESAGDSAAVGT